MFTYENYRTARNLATLLRSRLDKAETLKAALVTARAASLNAGPLETFTALGKARSEATAECFKLERQWKAAKSRASQIGEALDQVEIDTEKRLASN